MDVNSTWTQSVIDTQNREIDRLRDQVRWLQNDNQRLEDKVRFLQRQLENKFQVDKISLKDSHRF